MRRRAPIVVAAVAPLLCLCGLAFGAWSGIVDGTATALSQSLTGNQPTGTPSGGDVLVSWAASTFSDGTAATSYTVRRYQAVTGTEQTVLSGCAGSVTTTSCTESSVPAGSWQYTVTPRYSGWTGAESTKSDVVVVAAVVLDSTAPTTTASPSPTANAAGWHNADVTVSLSATDPSPGVVKQITYSASGAQTIASTTVLGSSATVPAVTTAGTTTLSYLAEDVAGNVESTKTLTIKLDKTAPATVTPTTPARIRNGQSLTGTYADNGGGSGIASVAYYYCLSTVTTCDATTGTGVGSSSSSPFSVTWNGQPADGSYKVVANALDAAGNAKLSNVVTTTVDNTAPAPTIISPANGATGVANGTVNISGTGGRGAGDATTVSVVVTISGTANAPVTANVNQTTGAWTISVGIGNNKSVSVTVTQTDGAGNSGSATSTFST